MEELEEQNAIHRFWGVHRRSEQRTKKPVCATWGVRMTVLTNDEYRGRQAAAIAMARANSYDVVLAWCRGASTQDHAADVLYLTGYYTPQPVIPDLLSSQASFVDEPVKIALGTWRWRAAGHAAAILTPDGKATLVADQPPRAENPAVADNILITSDPVAAVGDFLAELARSNLAKRLRVAVIGGEALAGRWERAFHARVLEAQFDDADDLAWRLRTVKSPAEQALLRAAGALGARGMVAAMAAAAPGATESHVVAACIAEVTKGGGAWYGGGLTSGPWACTFAPTGGEHGVAPSTFASSHGG